MSSKWELKEHSVGELTTTVSGDTWKKAQNKAFKKLAKNVELPGFRKGQAPESLIKKHISTQSILMEAVEEVAGKALMDGVEEHDLQLVARPQLDFDGIDEEKVDFKFIITVKPEVTLGEYKNLDVKKADASVTDEDVAAEVTRLQERYAELVVKEDGAVEEKDTAVIDFEGFKDGVAFEGGKGENYPLEIGSGSFIPGFEEQLIGMKAEETREIKVTFPENYQAADLAGQEATFKVTVHEIKTKELPAADDELIKQAEMKDIETLDAFKEHTKEELKKQKENKAEEDFTNELLTKVVDNASVDVPQVMIDEETDNMYHDFAQRLQSQGFGLEQYLQITGMSEESIRNEMAKDADKKVTVRLVLEAIADAEKLEVSEKEIEEEMESISKMYNMEIDKIKQMVSNDAVSYDLRMRKALELIKESAGK
ncbi:MAG: trigger factor [Erysipelotrichaceae bacterium]|jgi:trigger factor|nr:trigger factor [Erysipelotrichaceae bacterium]